MTTMIVRVRGFVLIGAMLFCSVVHAAESPSDFQWKAGTTKAVITPQKPLWMAGYGSRTAPAEGKLHDLWIRVLALEDAAGNRGIILASDTLGFPKSIYDDVCEQVKRRHGLDRSQVVLHASHTHCGPVLRGALLDIYPINEEQKQDINEYSDWLTNEVVLAIGKALADLQPATLWRGVGTTDFAVNRRTNREPDVVSLREQNLLLGPVDHTVPVLAVKGSNDRLKAVVFLYACHNTTLSFQKWCGDYAAFAQFALEEQHPDSVALFCMGCGADQNPLPRRTVELCEQYGQKLAKAVETELNRSMIPVPSKLKTAHAFVPLAMDPLPPVSQLEKMAAEPVSYSQRWANRLLNDVRNKVVHPREYPYPVQAWRLGGDQLWIMLGGEVVIDYGLRLKAEFGDQSWISAYANDVMAYIPSKRVLLEGGYEGQSSMMVYGQPAERWSIDVEDRVIKGVERVVEEVGSRQ
jgi:hypothetical protein